MSESINLVSTRNDQVEKELKRLKIFRIIAFSSLFGVALISVLFFIVTITLPISAVKKDQQDTKVSITSLHDKVVKYTLINDRVNNIEQTLSKRTNYTLSSNAIIKTLPEDLTADTLTIDTGTITVGVSGKSLLSINEVINKVVALGNEGKVIKNVIIKSLTLNSLAGTYTLIFSADII